MLSEPFTLGTIRAFIARFRGRLRSDVPVEIRALDFMVREYLRQWQEADLLTRENWKLIGWARRQGEAYRDTVRIIDDTGDYFKKLALRMAEALPAEPPEQEAA